MNIRNLGISIPIYTTRPSADTGQTCTYSQSAWISLLAQFIISINILLWGGIGIYEAIKFIV